MILYKYFPPERIDVLQNLKIRFSQPNTYNDPFEISPILTSEITKSQFEGFMPGLIQHRGGREEDIERLRNITFSDFQSDQTEILREIQLVMASGNLTLSLSEICDDLLMWAHYAFSHQGFVVGFDVEHEFFTCTKKTYFPRRISYKSTRPTVNLSAFNLVGAYLTKSDHWAYEGEWRLFRELPKGVSPEDFISKDLNGFPIYLFDLPLESIKEIILGCRSEFNSLDLVTEVARLKETKFPNAIVKKASLSSDEYKLILQ